MMIDTLVALLIILIFFGILWYVISLIPLPPPFATICQLVLVLLLVLVLFQKFRPLLGVG